MIPQLRISILAAVITAGSLFRVSAFAQDPVQTELAQLRKLIEVQSAKIDGSPRK